MSNFKVFDCNVVVLKKIFSQKGSLTVVQNNDNIPFAVKRIYYLYDVPSSEARGGHAHYELEQYIIAVSGSFDVVLDDGVNKKRVSLNRPDHALYIRPGLWRELENFSAGSICMVLASLDYDEKDYIRVYNEFLNYKLIN